LAGRGLCIHLAQNSYKLCISGVRPPFQFSHIYLEEAEAVLE
jgi:hypothetical protein